MPTPNREVTIQVGQRWIMNNYPGYWLTIQSPTPWGYRVQSEYGGQWDELRDTIIRLYTLSEESVVDQILTKYTNEV